MATGATAHQFRLPADAEARRILTAAQGKDGATPEGKAKQNLCKALLWAWEGMTATQKNSVTAQRPQFEEDIAYAQWKTDGFFSNRMPDDGILNILTLLVSVNPTLRHSAVNRIQDLDQANLAIINQTIPAIEAHVIQIETTNAHDALIDELFGVNQRVHVKLTFRLMLDSLKRLRTAGAFKVDTHGGFIRAGGLTNPTEMKLALKFFDASTTAHEREATLGHEGTHAIIGVHKTDDNGGYIGSNQFTDAASPVKILNAAHYEAVIRRLNGETLKAPAVDPGGAQKDITETVRKAWDRSLQFYTDLLHLKAQAVIPINQQGTLQVISHLFGLSIHKTADRSLYQIRDGDLAAAENRVGKLGVMLGAVNTAAQSLRNGHRAVTREALIAKLVEMEGPIRKTSDHQKTIDLIYALANLTSPFMGKRDGIDWFMDKYPLVKKKGWSPW